ncbi:calmodulin calcium-dependent NAD kinase [Mercurialis annua]|uniref:calmodulin calcium-dependent NAD kinase n=1 Tax=Mercurialis annua TaxID=3986 RepID=UPI002160ACCB|nr:calmodulin calcium-dependent NAD kinase [Mercurialis annua]
MKSADNQVILARIFAASLVGFVTVAAVQYRRKRTKPKIKDSQSIIPRLDRTGSGRVGNLERFSHYVARQVGFLDPNECPQLCKLAGDYLRKSEDCESNIFEYFGNQAEAEAQSLYVKLIEEFERCILTYFAFHWTQVPPIITQLMNEKSEKKPKLRDFVRAATRQQRFERVTRNLQVTRVFSTLVNEMKAIGKGESSDLMVPMALSERSPVLLLMGGGMGAGKSTVIKDILKESFWAGSAPLIVEADAFKESDVIYRALNAMGHHDDMLQTAELVHQSSTDAASSLLVTALNEGRDVIMDGTLSWEPFFEQTIAMARNVHNCRYRMGVGYRAAEDGTVIENYWEKIDEEEHEDNGKVNSRKPYRVELVGVVCDAYLAVIRGIRRAIMTKRAVRVNSQLKSHKRFANAFTSYCQLVDNARLYCTNSVKGPPKLIARKDGGNNLLIDPEEIKCLTNVSNLNPDAESIYELHSDPSPILESGSIWQKIVFTPSRPTIQSELKLAIQMIENSYPKLE